MTEKLNVIVISFALSFFISAFVICAPCMAESISYEVRERNRIKNLGIIKRDEVYLRFIGR